MIINSIKIANKIKFGANSKQSCPIFKGNEVDKFEKSIVASVETPEKKQNPNTAFLRDENLSYSEKCAKIEASPILFRTRDLSAKLGHRANDWCSRKCFELDSFKNLDLAAFRRIENTPNVLVVDLSIPINKENFETLEAIKDDIVGKEELKLKYGFSKENLSRYVKEGILKKVELKGLDGKPIEIEMFNVKDPVNQKAFERLMLFSPKVVRPTLSGIVFTKDTRGPINIQVSKLSKSGFGEIKELIQLIKKGTVEGEIKRNEEGKIISATININSEKTVSLLESMRNKRYISVEALAQRSRVEVKKIEDAILAGEIDVLKDLEIGTAEKSALIDVKNPENIEAFDKLLFERKIEEELRLEQELQTQKDEQARKKAKKQENRVVMSLRGKIAWHFCPNTRQKAKELFAKNKTLHEVLDKKEALENKLSDIDPRTEEELYFEIQNELIKLTKEEEILMKSLYGHMWSACGTEEFKEANAKAKEIIALYKEKGINAIKDPEVVKIISESKYA